MELTNRYPNKREVTQIFRKLKRLGVSCRIVAERSHVDLSMVYKVKKKAAVSRPVLNAALELIQEHEAA